MLQRNESSDYMKKKFMHVQICKGDRSLIVNNPPNGSGNKP